MTALWWQAGVIYHIYPRSFQDTDDDGIGDLKGIERRLEYLISLGVEAIWISPVYPSPMVDFGYDVADYCDVDPRFGTLADFDDLLMQAHRRGLKVLVDFVPNHTSDQHAWFVESRSSQGNQKRNWYIWRDPAPDGGPPNNWISDFGGSAWEWDKITKQYYYHAFLKEQPDLNWRHPAVRAAMYDVMRFWFDRGVDGFRIDVLWHMLKAADFPNNPPNVSLISSGRSGLPLPELSVFGALLSVERPWASRTPLMMASSVSLLARLFIKASRISISGLVSVPLTGTSALKVSGNGMPLNCSCCSLVSLTLSNVRCRMDFSGSNTPCWQ